MNHSDNMTKFLRPNLTLTLGTVPIEMLWFFQDAKVCIFIGNQFADITQRKNRSKHGNILCSIPAVVISGRKEGSNTSERMTNLSILPQNTSSVPKDINGGRRSSTVN